MKKIKNCSLVMIEWEDSAQPVPSWVFLSDYDHGDIIQCVSVGWLIHDGDDMKVLAPNMGHTNNEIYMLTTARKGIPSTQMARELGITQKSAWFLAQRIRETWCGGDSEPLAAKRKTNTRIKD